MSQHRIPTTKSKYYVPKETFLTVVHYCKQYPLWVDELSIEPDMNKGIDYDRERVQTSPSADQVPNIAIRRAEIDRKRKQLEDTAHMVADDLAPWVIRGACYDLPYHYLRTQGIPCGKDLYYSLRRKFYYEMAKRI